MQHISNQLVLNAHKVNGNTIKLILLIVSLTLFVLGAGAPTSGGGTGG